LRTPGHNGNIEENKARSDMLKSMTGFGSGEAPYGDGTVVVEITTVNGRHLDVTVRGLREYGSLELAVRSRVGEKLARGSVQVNVAVRGAAPAAKKVTADLDLARQYVNEFDRLHHTLNLKGPFPLEALTSDDRFLAIEEEPADEKRLGESLYAALGAALGRVVEMREAEGAKLAAAVKEKLRSISGLVDAVDGRAPAVVQTYREKLVARAAELGDGVRLDEGRLEAEVALFAERADITEEIVRSRAHLQAFEDALASAERVGRRLDFLTIELNREANTIAAKAQDAAVASATIEIKDLLEQVREQVQNIE
jgi:uncharacterized protein (TIGR00255 family)